MPRNGGHKHQINTSLHSKITNLFSSISYSRSSIPVKSRLTQSFPAPQNFPGTSQSSNLPSSRHLTNSDGTICDDNDNLLVHSGTDQKQREDTFSSQINSSESKKVISEAFLSKCLNVCKKYPALSQKSSFDQASKLYY